MALFGIVKAMNALIYMYNTHVAYFIPERTLRKYERTLWENCQAGCRALRQNGRVLGAFYSVASRTAAAKSMLCHYRGRARASPARDAWQPLAKHAEPGTRDYSQHRRIYYPARSADSPH